jgi:short-subunit dehydrogenase
LIARNGEELEAAAEELRGTGVQVATVVGDVGNREDAERAVQRAIDEYGRLDVLVNNAGIVQIGPLDHQSIEDFESAMQVHFWGPLYTTLAARPHMRGAGEGRIVNIASIGGRMSVPHLLPYSASKHALVGLSDGLRHELSREGIHVTTVSPGLMRTGSPFNALFKGRHEQEFVWFALMGTLPVSSISADEAARQIVEACRHGDAELTISWQAQAAAKLNVLLPGVLAKIMQLANAVLPRATGRDGDQLKLGWEVQNPSMAESPLFQPTYEAAERNNGTLNAPAALRAASKSLIV